MFNFFDELKSRAKFDDDLLSQYNMVNISGKLLYIEGHKGVTTISSTSVEFYIKRGKVKVEGENLFLIEMTQNTLLLRGEIKKVENF